MTCVTPLKRLPWFTAAVVEQLQPFRRALLVIDQVIFDVPPALEAIRRASGEHRPLRDVPGLAFDNDAAEFCSGLAAALSGWTDLRVLCSPTTSALSADHDEYTTFFSESPGKIAAVRHELEAGGVRLVGHTATDP